MSSRLVKSWKEWDAENPAVRSLWTTSTGTSSEPEHLAQPVKTITKKAETATVDEPSGRTPEEVAVPQKRVSSKQRRLSLDEYRTAYLQVPKITDRKPVFVSGEVRDRLDGIVRRLGGRGMSASGLIENLARLHLETYREDIEQWRKL